MKTETTLCYAPMTKKQAIAIAGSLSDVSKMNCYSSGTPAEECITGSKLAVIPGTVCFGCYALKGFYALYAKTIKPAQYKRLEGINHPLWVSAMVKLIGDTAKKTAYFRWHDSGDLQSVEHLSRICEIAVALPHMKFWLPTREYEIVKAYGKPFPENLVVRLSAHKVDGLPPDILGLPTSTVHKDTEVIGNECIAPKQNNTCGDCRACWQGTVQNVGYHKH